MKTKGDTMYLKCFVCSFSVLSATASCTRSRYRHQTTARISPPAIDADTENDTTYATGSAESVAASSHTCDCCEVCLLQPSEGVARVPCGHSRVDSVAVAQTLSRPSTVVARYAAYPFAWCRIFFVKCTLSEQ